MRRTRIEGGVARNEINHLNMRGNSTNVVILLSVALHLSNGLRIPYPPRATQMYKVHSKSMTLMNERLDSKPSREVLYSHVTKSSNPVTKSNASMVPKRVDSRVDPVYQNRTNAKTIHRLLPKLMAEDNHEADGLNSVRPSVREGGSTGPLYGSCPGMCQCNLTTATVTCTSGFWRHIPKLPGNCTKLTIQTGQIPTLEAHSFSLYPNLTMLNLKQVNMNMIRSGAFQGLPSLGILSLNRNKLYTLPTSVFQNTPVLNILYLNENDFRELPHPSICIAKHLVNLYVIGNKLTNLSFPLCYLNLSHLSTLDLSGNPFNEIHKQDFVNLKLSPLRTLRLSNCKLKQLQEDVFEHLQGLSTISLSGNKLETLPKNIFKKLTYLSNLYVSHNNLHIFVPLWITGRPKTLNFGYNHITSFNTFDAQPLSRVTDLTLENNRLVNLSSRLFIKLGLYSLESLDLMRCSLRNISSDAFQNLTHLKALSLTDNPLSAAALQQAFTGLPINSLQRLSLDTLHLQDINDTTFIHLAGNNVTELVLDHSGIEKIPHNVFNGFLGLKTLSLKFNNIVTIDGNPFLPLTKLDKLLLSNNHLIYCINPLHAGLSSTLTSLNLANNLIQKIGPECIQGLDQLRNLQIVNNKLGSSGLQTNAFTGSNITTLGFSRNQLTVLANATFNNMSSLVDLSLHDNALDKVETGCFQGLSSLSALYLSNNRVLGNHIDSLQIALSDVPKLCTLDLALCGIHRLPVALLYKLTKLTTLVLTNNAIISWEPEFFLNQRSLTFLHLRRNKIVTINSTSVQNLPALREIYLDFNPFSCSCNIREFRNWILSGRFYVDLNVYDNKSYACALPPKVKGIPLLDVDLGFRVCGPINEIIGGSVGGFALFVVTITSVIIYRYRWYIRYGCFLVKGRLRQRRNQERLVECTYDAFVSYNHGDQRWVIEHLLPELEYKGNIRLCLHDRDWLAGPDVADNIIDSIEDSHKTILVLSNHFAQSQWCELEMSMAQHKLLTSQKDVLVLVIKDPIDDCYMTSRLRYLMTTQTYLAWEAGDPQKVRRFWKALRQAVKGREAV